MLQCVILFLCLMMSLPLAVQLALVLLHLLGAGLLHQYQLSLPGQLLHLLLVWQLALLLLHLLLVLRLHLELGLELWRAVWGVVGQLPRDLRGC